MGELADKLRYAMQDGTIRTEILGTAKLILEGRAARRVGGGEKPTAFVS